MRTKVKYKTTFLKVDNSTGFYESKSINKTRKFIEKNFPIILSTWKESINIRSNKTERVFRNRTINEPSDYWNNNIKANVKYIGEVFIKL